MKRTNEEIINSIIKIMSEHNFDENDVNHFTREADFEQFFTTEKYHKWLLRQERFYSNHYRLGNEIFTICKKPENMIGIHYSYSNIREAYDRPSIRKVRIWEDWVEELSQFSDSIYIPSRNGFQFTIGGELIHPTTGEVVPFYITKTGQEIYI